MNRSNTGIWIMAVLTMIAVVYWVIQSHNLDNQLKVANANAAMLDLGTEIMSYRTQTGCLPDQLMPKYKDNGSGVTEVDDPFEGFRRRWPSVKLIEGPSPAASGVSITYCTSAVQGEFYLIAYDGNRRICDRTFN